MAEVFSILDICIYWNRAWGLIVNTLEKLEILNENCSDCTELDRILGQLLSVILTHHRQKLSIYDRDISKFEQTYAINSDNFHS